MGNEIEMNAQKVSSEAQYEIRKIIVRMLKNGYKGKEIAKQLGVSEGHVSNVKKAYEKDGINGTKRNKAQANRQKNRRKKAPDT